MNILHLLIKYNLTARQALVIELLGNKGMTAGELAEHTKQRISTIQNSAEALCERLIVRRSKERHCFFVYRLTERGIMIAKMMLESEAPASPAPVTNDLIIPGIFNS